MRHSVEAIGNLSRLSNAADCGPKTFLVRQPHPRNDRCARPASRDGCARGTSSAPGPGEPGAFDLNSDVSARRIILTVALLAAGLCFAQPRPGADFDPRAGLPGNLVQIEGGLIVNEDELRTARETDSHASGTATWTSVLLVEK